MNCQNCGANIDFTHQFCRSCGTELIADIGQPRINVQMWGLLALVLIFGGLLTAMAGKMWDMKPVLFFGLIITFSGMFGIAAYGMLQQSRPKRKRRSVSAPPQAASQPELSRADTTNKLPPLNENEFTPSVIDDTTELLKTPLSRSDQAND